MGIVLHGTEIPETCDSLDSIIDTADMDFGVQLVPEQITWLGEVVPTGGYSIVRDDNGAVLGTGVSQNYNAKNARDSFAVVDEFLRTGRATPVSAGMLRDNKEAFVQLKLDRSVQIADGDVVEQFLWMHTGFDGHHALSGILGPIRLWCTNMIPLATGRADSVIRYSHTSSLDARLEAVAETMGVVDRYVNEFEETANGLVVAKFSTKQMQSFLSRLIPIPKDQNPDKDRAAKSKQEARDAIMAIFANADNLANCRETKWAAYNSVAEYFDHTVAARSRTPKDVSEEQAALIASESKMTRMLEDTRLKDKAFQLLTASSN